MPHSLPHLTVFKLSLLLLIVAVSGCSSRSPLPDLGPPLPVWARVEFEPTLTAATLRYVNSCNSPRELALGPQLEELLTHAANRLFERVFLAKGRTEDRQPDLVVRIGLRQADLKIRTDNVYDRAPAELTVEAVAVYLDPSGAVFAERPIRKVSQERLQVELTQRRCDYVSIDRFTYDASLVLATQFARETRAVLETAEASRQPTAQPAKVSPQSSQGTPRISFKASVQDENSNLVLEAGERLRVRVDLVNAGTALAQDISVELSGTAVLVAQFPATTLPVGPIQPGESRSVDFSAIVPQAMQDRRAELTLSVRDGAGNQPTSQTLVLAVQPQEQTTPSSRKRRF